MKRILLTLAVVAASALTMYGQGRVAFNNGVSGNLISITNNPAFAAPGQGAPGSLLGANYSIQLLWAPQGTYTNPVQFLAAVLGSSGPVSFFGGAGAGFFDGGAVPNPVGTSMPVGTYTMAARAWYNGGTYATHDAALAGNANTGWSQFFNISPTASPSTPPNTTFPSFAVFVPEPSTFVLAGLGIASLLLFRRRK